MKPLRHPAFVAPLLSVVSVLSVLFSSAQDAEVQVAKAVPTSESAAPEPAKEDDSPVPLPALSHFERLWKDSMFTTKALPTPDVPAGPNFADNYSLSGTFEERGKMTAILIDKSTSGIVQAYIGEDNDEGFRIAKIEPGDSPEKMRIQIQKGNQAGWVKFADSGGEGGITMQQPGQGAPNNGPLATRPGGMPAPQQGTIPQAPVHAPKNIPRAEPISSIPAVPTPEPVPAPPSLQGGMPQAPATLPGDPPLPPP